MANIESKLNTIRSASGGEDVRDAIIGALRDINNDVPADMSNPKQKEYNMPSGSDLTVPINPPELISQIIVRQPNTGGKSMKLVDATITENGEYPTPDKDDGGGSYDPDEEIRYYNKVTVKVPQLANAVLDLEEEITQNGTYSAPADWGVDGLRTFTVNVHGTSGDGPFTVDFYDKPSSDPSAKSIETQIVAYGGNAEFNGVAPTSIIGPLTGWNPSPVNVTRNMKCYPVFGQIIIDPTDIGDDWDVICQKRGAGYPLGSHKILAYGATFTSDEVKKWYPTYSGGDCVLEAYMNMYKVAEGEGSSTSSWISTPISLSSIPGTMQLGSGKNSWYKQFESHNGLREFLNGPFFSHMDSMFKNNIVTVTKTSIDLDNNQYIPKPTQDTIWIPNLCEIGTWQTGTEETGYYDFLNSSTWSDSSVYVQRFNLLNASSKKYVIDYLNNDRTFPYRLARNHMGTPVGNCLLRDQDGSDTMMYYRSSNPYIELYSSNNGVVNIGFCL
ncbi:MAG: hypothetical protein IJ880_10655 [Bacilli bacterium]|nr:hypothetical protein [Bacilli bacterium]